MKRNRHWTLPVLLLPALFLAPQDPAARRWNLEVENGMLKPIAVREGASRDTYRTFWYLTLKVTNRTGKSQRLSPMAEALTPQDHKHPRSLAGLYPEIVEKISVREKRKLTNLLVAPKEIADGESLDLVLVFPRLSRISNTIEIRVSGLASRLYKVGRSSWIEDRVLSILFRRRGDEFHSTMAPIVELGRAWKTLSRTKIRG